MDIKIPEFGTLQMTRTNPAHFGTAPLSLNATAGTSSKSARDLRGLYSGSYNSSSSSFSSGTLNSVSGNPSDVSNSAGASSKSSNTFIDALNALNQQQLAVSEVQQKLITDPDSVDIHDVTTAMAKAQMSLDLAQNVIDRLVKGWNELSQNR